MKKSKFKFEFEICLPQIFLLNCSSEEPHVRKD